MRKLVVMVCALLAVCVTNVSAALVTFDDAAHDWAGNPQPEYGVYVQNSPAGQFTTLNLHGGGVASSTNPLHDSRVNIFAGTVYNTIEPCDNSVLNVYNGTIPGRLCLFDYSQTSMSGVSTNEIWFEDSSSITISDSDFAVTDGSVGHGIITATNIWLTGELDSATSLGVDLRQSIAATVLLASDPTSLNPLLLSDTTPL